MNPKLKSIVSPGQHLARISLIECFSALVASGNGSYCNKLKTMLHESLWQQDGKTDKLKLLILKYHRESMPEDFERLSKELAEELSEFLSEIN